MAIDKLSLQKAIAFEELQIDRQSKIVIDGLKKKGERRMDCPTADQLLDELRHRQFTNYLIQSTWILTKYPPSSTSVRKLEKIFVPDLRLQTRHEGCVLILKIIGDAVRNGPMSNVVQDERGNAERLHVYFQSIQDDSRSILPKDRIIAIKEPFYTIHTDGRYAIRIDHPSDLLMLPIGSEFIPRALQSYDDARTLNANGWRLEGNSAIGRRNYRRAVELYTRGMQPDSKPTQNDMCLLSLNRSLAHLKLKQFEAAEGDALSAISETSTETLLLKGFLRAAQACYELSKFDKAQELLQKALQNCSTNSPLRKESLDLAARTSARIAEQSTCRYDFTAMSQLGKCEGRQLDHASFTRRVIVKDAGAHGRGLFAAEAVHVGDLLLCEKASCSTSVTRAGHLAFIHDTTIRRNSQAAVALLSPEVAQKAFRNPSLGQKVLDLHAGSYPRSGLEGTVVDGQLVVDTFLIHQIVSKNSFQISDGNEDQDLRESTQGLGGSKLTTCSGIFNLASYTNHSCYPNALRKHFGDMIVVRASQPIQKGDEILLDYIKDDRTPVQRKTALEQFWGIVCDCQLCEIDRKALPTFRDARQKLTGSILSTSYQTHNRTQAHANNLEQQMMKLSNLYDKELYNDDVPRLQLSDAMSQLSLVYMMLEDATKTERFALAALRNRGYRVEITRSQIIFDWSHGIPSVHCQTACSNVACVICFVAMRDGKSLTAHNSSLVRQWLALEKMFYRILEGEDDTHEEEITKKLPEELRKQYGACLAAA